MSDLNWYDKQLISFIRDENVTVWGPYLCKDGRMRVDVKPDSASRRTTHQLAKLKLELKLGRRLKDGETVDHVDGDFTNDSTNNLRPLSLAANVADSVKRLEPKKFICPTCSKTFTLLGRRLNHAANNRSNGNAGPFCNRSCAGTYGSAVRNGKSERLSIKPIQRSYFSNKQIEGRVAKLVETHLF